jgi:outer membrane protein OmpA-like peptidoglycan-associated protein/opacity protein-like surface antigen
MKIKTTLLAAAATIAIAPAAHAYDGLYGAVGAGLSYLGSKDITNDQPGGGGPFAFDSSADYDNGIGVYAALGYAYQNNMRFEFEFSYRSSDIDQIDSDGAGFSGWPAGGIGGDVATTSLMVNALYDFNRDGWLNPYIGFGAGMVNIDPDITGNNALGAPISPLTVAYGKAKWAFGYQAIGGVAIDLAEGLLLDLSYRYHDSIKEPHQGTLGGVPAAFEMRTDSHNAFLGLRWDFSPDDAAPVAPQFKDCWDGSSVPVTAECPPQMVDQTDADLDPVQFTVYFDYDKSNLTSQASDLIREAAARALENDIETVVVAGNTDTSGGSAYNQALSERRARAVRDGLIANGVPADRISLEAYGETNLAKPTADGVREPLNRRADVVISFM